MPTQNRRVATYLPPELDDRFKAFIEQRNLKGDSQALIVILSEFLGVGLPVAQKVDYSGFVKLEQFNELMAKVSELSVAVESKSPGAILNKLLEKVNQLEKRIDNQEPDKPQAEAQVEAVPGQMSLLEASKSELLEKAKSELPKSVDSELASELQPIDEVALAIRLGCAKKTLSNNRSKWKNDLQRFSEWLRVTDPDKIPWQYNAEDKLYHPLVESDLSQTSPSSVDAESNQEG